MATPSVNIRGTCSWCEIRDCLFADEARDVSYGYGRGCGAVVRATRLS